MAKADKKITVSNPFNLKAIEELALTSPKDLQKYLEEASRIADNCKKWIPKRERIEILKSFKELLLQNKDDLVGTAISEGGKPYRDSVVEIERGIEGVEIATCELRHLAGREIPMNLSAASEGRMAFTFHRPRGLMVAISAFNHPFNLIIHQVIPAVAAGCPFLVKPSTSTPLSCQNIVELLHRAGLDPSYGRMVLCSNQEAETLVTHPTNRFLSFIGSSKVGWWLRSKLPPGANCALEHGGVAPVIVDRDTNLQACLPPLVKGAYYHAGQVCVSVQRIFVHHSQHDEFVKQFSKMVKKLRTGDPSDKKTDVGPLIDPRETERISQWVDEAIEQGAVCTMGGKKISETLYAPTVLSNVPETVTIARQEVFGPVAIVQSYQHFDEAIERANKVEYAFQAAIFTQNLERALQAAQELEGLSIMINDHTAFRVDWMPFGGYKQSGLGTGGIGHSLRDLCLEKMVVLRSNQ